MDDEVHIKAAKKSKNEMQPCMVPNTSSTQVARAGRWVESDAKKSLGWIRWHAATLKSRLTEPLALSDAKKSLDEAAGTQRHQKVA